MIMDNLKMQTANKADENFKKLMEMFPNAVTETMDQIVDFGSDDAMQKKWKTFVRKFDRTVYSDGQRQRVY